MSKDIVEKTKKTAGLYFKDVKGEKPFDLWRSFDPDLAKMMKDMENMQNELKDLQEQVKEQESILKVLQGLPEDADISSVQEVIQLGRKKNRQKGEKAARDNKEKPEGRNNNQAV